MSKRFPFLCDPGGDPPNDRDLTKLLHDLIDRCDNPAQLVEILYWNAEAELAEIMREYLALPVAAKQALHAFLVMTRSNTASVTASFSALGLTLSSPAIADYVRTMSDITPRPGTSNLH